MNNKPKPKPTGAPSPKPAPMSAEEEEEYRAEVAAYQARIKAIRNALRALARTYGRTELSAAWQEFASEGEGLPGAIGHHTRESEAAARAAQGASVQRPKPRDDLGAFL